RKVFDALRLCTHECKRSRGSRGFKANGKEHYMFVWICSGQLERVRRRIDDADISAARLMFQWAALRAWNAHHIAERSKNHIGISGHGKAIVNSAHGQNAHRAAGAMDQFNAGRKNILQTKTVDSVRVSAKNLHKAVMSRRIHLASQLFCSPGNNFWVAKFINKSHLAPLTVPVVTL